MSRYIDAELLEPDTEWDDYEDCYISYSDYQIRCAKIADVRENITAHKVIGGGEHDGATCWFECSRCGKTVDVNDKYCSECGVRFEK